MCLDYLLCVKYAGIGIIKVISFYLGELNMKRDITQITIIMNGNARVANKFRVIFEKFRIVSAHYGNKFTVAV